MESSLPTKKKNEYEDNLKRTKSNILNLIRICRMIILLSEIKCRIKSAIKRILNKKIPKKMIRMITN
jgi:hypothetical protein